jgi:hypothetical protein
MLLSDFLKNGATLQGKAGIGAINANDLLLINALGQLYPVSVSDNAAVGNAAASIVANTVLTNFALTTSAKKELFVNPVDGSYFLAAPYLTTNCGLTLFKYSSAGALLGSVIIDSTALTTQCPIISQLSNGNLCVSWAFYPTSPGLYFAIVDTNLNIVVAKGASIGAIASQYYDQIALTGGGFAVALPMPGGTNLAIYTNTGGVTFASTLIPSTPTTGQAISMAQLSSGNIAIAINSGVAASALGHVIRTVAGVAVLAYTVLDTATSAGNVYPAISTMTGFYCCAIGDGTQVVGSVLNNAGALQGGAFTGPSGSGGTTGSGGVAVVNDGVNFWAVYNTTTATIQGVAMLPTSGTGFVSTPWTTAGSLGSFNIFLERGVIVVVGTSTNHVLNLLSSGKALLFSSANNLAGLTSALVTARPSGDFSFVMFNVATTCNFGVQKYMNAAVVGIAQTTIAAGNANLLVPYSMGPGGYPCNPTLGTVGKGFDHSATNLIGNKGTILGNSASLKGI